MNTAGLAQVQNRAERREYFQRGAVERHIIRYLTAKSVGTVEQLTNSLPGRSRHPGYKAAVAYKINVLYMRRKIDRILRGAYVLAGDRPCWRFFLEQARPDWMVIINAMGVGWRTTEQIHRLIRMEGGREYSTQNLLRILRELRRLELVVKSGKGDWCVTRRLDMPLEIR